MPITQSLKSNNAINAHSIDESNHTRQDLNLQPRDKKRRIVNVDLDEACVEVFGC
jgi:hypothetical protein